MKWPLAMLCLSLASLPVVQADSKKLAFDPFAYPHGVPRPVVRDSGYSGLGADSISAEDIAKFAPAPLDPAMSRRIQAMLDVRGTGGGLVTAKGDRMYFTWRVTGTSQVWRQDGPMKFPVQLTGGEDNTTAVGLAPDDSFVVVSRDVGGEENPGLYLLAPDGGPLKVIQHTPKVQTSLAMISDDAKTVYYRANDRDPASYAIYSYDVKAGTRQLVFDKSGIWILLDHRGGTWLLAKALGNTHVEIYEYDVASKTLQPMLGQNENEDYSAVFGPKPGQLLVRTNKLGDFHRVYSFEAGKLTPVTPELKYDVTSLVIDQPRTHVYYTVDEGGYTKLTALDAKTLKPVALPKLPAAELTTLASVSVTGRFVQLSLSSSTQVPSTLTFDWQSRRVDTWQAPATPEIDVSTFAKVTLETYPARDGTQIPMFVRRPARCASDRAKADEPCPVIVSFHGGPEGEATAGFSAAAQLFVDAGFIFVQPNVRGSTGYGKAWLHADDGPKRLDVITDIEDCAKFIRTAWASSGGGVPKIGVTGGSYGGYATLMAMTYFAGAYDVGVEQVGMSNLVTFLVNTAPYRRILRTSEYGDPDKDKDALVKLSPITYVDRVKAPLLLIGGVNDPRVPVGESLQIRAELEKRNVPVGLILFADEGHGASKRSNIVMTLGHTLAFFEKHLR